MSVCLRRQRRQQQQEDKFRSEKKDGSQGVWQRSGWAVGDEGRGVGWGVAGRSPVSDAINDFGPATTRPYTFSINSRKRKCWWRSLPPLPACLPACQWHLSPNLCIQSLPPLCPVLPRSGASVICLAVIAGVLPLTASACGDGRVRAWLCGAKAYPHNTQKKNKKTLLPFPMANGKISLKLAALTRSLAWH